MGSELLSEDNFFPEAERLRLGDPREGQKQAEKWERKPTGYLSPSGWVGFRTSIPQEEDMHG